MQERGRGDAYEIIRYAGTVGGAWKDAFKFSESKKN